MFNPSANDDRIVQLSDAGTLLINRTEDKDEGIYQCFAKNDFGRSASKIVNLRQAKLASFAFARPTYHTPLLGRPYTLFCVPPESVPPATVFWITKTAQGGFNVVNYDSRVSVDRECKFLLFKYLFPMDIHVVCTLTHCNISGHEEIGDKKSS